MRALLLLAVLLSLAFAPAPLPRREGASCPSNNKGKIEGTKWSSLALRVEGLRIPAGFLRLEFASDGGLTYTAGPQTFTGTYSLGPTDRVTLTLGRELAGRKVHTQKVSVSGERLTMSDTDGTSMTFEKVK